MPSIVYHQGAAPIFADTDRVADQRELLKNIKRHFKGGILPKLTGKAFNAITIDDLKVLRARWWPSEWAPLPLVGNYDEGDGGVDMAPSSFKNLTKYVNVLDVQSHIVNVEFRRRALPEIAYIKGKGIELKVAPNFRHNATYDEKTMVKVAIPTFLDDLETYLHENFVDLLQKVSDPEPGGNQYVTTIQDPHNYEPLLTLICNFADTLETPAIDYYNYTTKAELRERMKLKKTQTAIIKGLVDTGKMVKVPGTENMYHFPFITEDVSEKPSSKTPTSSDSEVSLFDESDDDGEFVGKFRDMGM